MTTSPYVVPTYRALTIVSTALTRNEEGDMIHHLVVDTTLSEPHGQLVYEIVPVKPASASGKRNAR
jgi:hypothetical protein